MIALLSVMRPDPRIGAWLRQQTRVGWFAASLALIAIGCTTTLAPAPESSVDNPDCPFIRTRALRGDTVDLRHGAQSVRVEVEVATDAQDRVRGLMCRTSVPPGTGMLFEQPAESIRGYWMFNTYVPLDLLYMDLDGVTVAVATLQPCPRTEGEDDSTWRTRCAEEAEPHAPDAPYWLVLELPAGWLQSQGISPSDTVGRLTMER